MVDEKYRVRWSFQSLEDLKTIYEYIFEQSPKGADIVFDTLIDLGDTLESFPDRFPIEQNITSKYFVFRYIPKWNYKILYRVNPTTNTVIIARIVSTRQNPDSIEVL